MSINDDLTLTKAKLAILDAKKSKPLGTKVKPTKLNNQLLFKALDDVAICTTLLPDEERKVLESVRKIEGNKANDKYWDIRINYLLDNLEVMKTVYPIYEDEAKRRKELITKVTRQGKWREEKEKCAADTVDWFNNYSWTADRRKDGIGWALPFMLYDFQEEAIQ